MDRCLAACGSASIKVTRFVKFQKFDLDTSYTGQNLRLSQYRRRGHLSAMTGENTRKVSSYPPDGCRHSDPHPIQGGFFNGTA